MRYAVQDIQKHPGIALDPQFAVRPLRKRDIVFKIFDLKPVFDIESQKNRFGYLHSTLSPRWELKAGDVNHRLKSDSFIPMEAQLIGHPLRA